MILVAGFIGLIHAPVLAAPDIVLVTYGPGPEVWERFGHNALWVRDAENGIDQLYNYGFFDFAQPGFIPRFVRGRMIYYAAATDPRREFPFYEDRNRSIWLQPLSLDETGATQLARALERSVQPQNRDYLYDYFRANCSTRVRDVLDEVLHGRPRQELTHQPADMTYRQSALLMVQDDFWLYLGIQLALGRPSDAFISQWDMLYLPHEVSKALDGLEKSDGTVLADTPYIAFSGQAVPQQLNKKYAVFALLGLFTAAFLLSTAWLAKRGYVAAWVGRFPLRLWLLTSGLAGLLLLLIWLFSDHQAAWRNENILLLSPLGLLLVWPIAQVWRLRLVKLIALMLGMALLLKAMPGAQFNLDLMLWLLPAQLAALWIIGCDGTE